MSTVAHRAERAAGLVSVPVSLLAAAAALSRHTGCADECVLGAAIAAGASRADGMTRLGVTVRQGGGQHVHVYDTSRPVSFRGLLAQRSVSEAPADRWLAITVHRAAGEVRIRASDPAGWDAEDLMMLQCLQALIEDAVARPDSPVSGLCLVCPAERERMLRDWNRTDRSYDPDVTVIQLVAGQARRAPLSVALVDSTTMSYAQLNEEANRLAGLLRRLGVGPGSLVGLYLGRSQGAVISLLAVLKAGAAYLPLDPAYPAQRLQYMISDSDVALILTERAHVGSCPGQGRRVVVIDGDARTLIAAESPADPLPHPSPDGRAYVIYTSGSTGAPKGVEVEHRSLVNRLLGTIELIGLDSGDGLLSIASLSFDIAALELLAPLIVGGRVILADPAECGSGARLAGLLRRSGATVLQATPTTWQLLLAAAPELPPITALCGGEPMPPSVARRLVGSARALWNVYGPTETTIWSTAARIGPADVDRPPVGLPLANTRVYILGDAMQPVPVGHAGELCIGGAGVARGYLNRPELTGERFVDDPFVGGGERIYRTGDLARYRPDGVIELLGRRDHQVKVSGHRVELGEVEATLAALPGIGQAAVGVRESTDSVRELVAAVTPREPGISIGQMRALLAERLPGYMIPVQVACVDQLPMLPNGKIDRGGIWRLAARPTPPPPDPGPAGAPAGERPQDTPAGERLSVLEREMAAIWAAILQVPDVGTGDDFFALGGTSVRAAQLVHRLERISGDHELLYVRAVFDAPTLSEFCAYLAREYPSLAARLSGTQHTQPVNELPPRSLDAGMRRRFRRIVRGTDPAPMKTRLPRAAFILSAPRSGSTLLRVMLAGHPRVFAPPELELLGFGSMAARARAFQGGNSFAHEGLIRAVQELMSLTPQQARAFVARQDGSVADMYAQLQQRLGDRLLVDKTAAYALDEAALRRAEGTFEDALYIRLIRHPAGMVNSYRQARLDQVFRHEHSFRPAELAELTWLTANENLDRFLGSVPAHRHTLVRFEDLVASPRRVLAELAEFLGIPYHDGMLDPYADLHRRMVDGPHAESRMAGDPTFLRRTHVDPAAADEWRAHLDLASLSPLTRALGKAYGYLEQPVTPVRTAPLTAHQRSIYLHQDVSGEPTLYNICKAWRLRGELDTLALRAALQDLVDRHEALRTIITVSGATPIQQVLASRIARLDRIDLAPDAPAEAMHTVLREFAATVLDLASGPVFRALLVSLGERDHVLSVLVHHAVVDGSSLAILLGEASRAYQAAMAGTDTGAAPGRHFIDAVATASRDPAAELEFWRQALAGAPPLLPLPAARPRPSRKTYRGGRVPVSFAGDNWHAVGRLAKQEGATPFIVLLTAFKALLRRYMRTAGNDRIVVGTAFVNRHNVEDDAVVGMFTGTIPLCTRIDDDPTFRELLARVRDTCLSAYEHHDVPFEDLVRELGIERDPSYSPLVQVLFASEPPQAQELRLPGIDVEGCEIDWLTSKFDLTVSLIAGTGELGGWWEYDADLFDADQIQRMITHFVNLLRQAAQRPDRPISDYDILDPAEAQQALYEWSSPGSPPSPGEPLESVIRGHARLRPSALAVAGDGHSLTYAELDAASDDLAARLIAHGVGADDIVAVLCHRSAALVAGCLGILKSGAAYLPIDQETPPQRIEYMLNDAGVRVAVVSPGLGAALPAKAIRCLEVDLATAARPAPVNPKHNIEGRHLAYVIYTSGSAGEPKGVLVERHSLENFVSWFTERYRLGPADECTQTVNVGFDACVMEMWPTLASGATLNFAPAATVTDPAEMWRWLGKVGATVSFIVTPLAEAMLAEEIPAGLALRTVVTGGDRLHPQPALRAAPFQLVNGYGPTENTILSTVEPVDPADAALYPPPIGRAVPGTSAYILDERMRPVPVGVEGELYLGGHQVARGYLNLPELTRERFVPDPFAATARARLYRTGDRARYRPDGSIDFLGRLDGQVKVRGFRIELGEIEAALGRIAGVRDAAVVATGTGNDRHLDAFYLSDVPIAPADLRNQLRQTLPAYMIPARFTALDAMPVSANGKVDRRALAARSSQAPAASGAELAAPLTEAESALLGLWRLVLGTGQVGVTDSFFEHGGHSLNAMRLTSLIREKLGWQVGLPMLFGAPTVRELAAALTAAEPRHGAAIHLVELRSGGGGTPVVCVHPSDGNVLAYLPLRTSCPPGHPIWGLQAGPAHTGGPDSVEAMAATYLADLHTVSPSGPVHLLGWSFGGLVAFEMARQLRAAGRAVGGVLLLDSEPLTRQDEVDSEEDLVREFGWQLRRRAGASSTGPLPDNWPALARQARESGWVDADAGGQQLRQAYERFRRHVLLGRKYLPEPIDHPLTVFVATERAADLREAQITAWADLTTAGIAVTELPGDHFDAVCDAALRTVAAAITRHREWAGPQ